ncbi:bacterial transcriptional activator domain-containing protein [Microbispora amethystogenes]|uniref:bacterial transcriptional activator domain-containing protein n=1 Tax=Microbispora amethystogenes TaxID=1427754 RepID=UPI003410E4AF
MSPANRGDLSQLALGTPVIENIRAKIVDTANLLVELELDVGRPDRSARAARQGLASGPYAEQFWRALKHAQYEAGNISRFHQAWKACLKAVAEVSADGDPHPDRLTTSAAPVEALRVIKTLISGSRLQAL